MHGRLFLTFSKKGIDKRGGFWYSNKAVRQGVRELKRLPKKEEKTVDNALWM
jgi:hypothetical protein